MKHFATTPRRATRRARRLPAAAAPLAGNARTWRWYTGPGHQFPIVNERTLEHWRDPKR